MCGEKFSDGMGGGRSKGSFLTAVWVLEPHKNDFRDPPLEVMSFGTESLEFTVLHSEPLATKKIKTNFNLKYF